MRSLCPMQHRICAAAIGRAVGYMFCFIVKTIFFVLETTRRLPASEPPPDFICGYGYRLHAHFCFSKKKQKQGTKDGK